MNLDHYWDLGESTLVVVSSGALGGRLSVGNIRSPRPHPINGSLPPESPVVVVVYVSVFILILGDSSSGTLCLSPFTSNTLTLFFLFTFRKVTLLTQLFHSGHKVYFLRKYSEKGTRYLPLSFNLWVTLTHPSLVCVEARK